MLNPANLGGYLALRLAAESGVFGVMVYYYFSLKSFVVVYSFWLTLTILLFLKFDSALFQQNVYGLIFNCKII